MATTRSSRAAKPLRPRARPTTARSDPASKATTKASSKTATKGLTRIDHDASRTHGYFVRIGYERKRPGSSRPRYVKFFGDATQGGKRRALMAAEAWAAKMRAQDVREQRASQAAAVAATSPKAGARPAAGKSARS